MTALFIAKIRLRSSELLLKLQPKKTNIFLEKYESDV